MTARLRAARERVEEYERFQVFLRGALESLERPADTEKGCGADCPCVSPPETPPAGVVSLPLLSAGAAPSCSLGDTALTQRLERWRGLLVDAEPYPGPRGRVWALPIEHAGAVAELAAAETACCPFLELRIDFTPETVRLHARLAPEVAPDLDGRTAEAVRWLTGGPDEDTEDARP
ncbi:hypothetical protein J4H86_14790 [Spiractinospora alimapuensis]|uniref:hypothetical protein n=1 Tax=Spiractinospora alimapuensis TaxID=2820884 RepID=UPI001F1E22E5|nr:hypothetical protein [Spiractinospora alimapuensis]QVQ50217.1 hypothetical protein J4H86_14790 [Spiractinospora alimapuensis]